MTSFIEQAQSYASYQQNVITRYIHMLSLPLIIVALMIFLGFVRIIILGVLDIDLAQIATFALLIYYCRLQWRLALALAPPLVFFLWIAGCFSYDGPTSIALWAFAITLFLGCTLQLIGYFIEGKRPSFHDMLKQLIIAPLTIIAELFFMIGRMRDLKEKIYGNRMTDISEVS
jgi:uncharacterized membrane protein YGL010W